MIVQIKNVLLIIDTSIDGYEYKKLYVINVKTVKNNRPLISFCPLNWIGWPLMIPWSFPKAIKLPVNVTAPIITLKNIAKIWVFSSIEFVDL